MYRILTWIILLPLLISSDRVGYASRVLELSDRFLEIRKDGEWLVKFYAPWCGYCKKMEPIFSHVAQALHDTPIRVGKVDCTRFPSVGTEFQVSGFPTIMFLKGAKKHVYTGERGTEDIVAYAKRMAGPAVREFYADVLKKSQNIFFGFVGNKPGDDLANQAHKNLWTAFVSVAEDNQAHLDFYTIDKSQQPEFLDLKNNKKVGPEEELEPSWVIVHKDQESYMFEYDDKSENLTLALGDWVQKERFPRFPKVSRSNFQQLLATKKFIVMAVVEEDKLERIVSEDMIKFKNMMDTFVSLNGHKYRKYFQFGWVGSPELANSVAMATLPVPSLLVVNSTSYHHHIPIQHDTHEDIEGFLQQLINQTAKAYGGNTWSVRLYRTYYESKISLVNMWSGNPVLTALLFGLPLGFMSLICYSICCADILDNNELEDEDYGLHEKKE